MQVAGDAESDDKEDARTRKEIKLYRCSDAEGTLKITEVRIRCMQFRRSSENKKELRIWQQMLLDLTVLAEAKYF